MPRRHLNRRGIAGRDGQGIDRKGVFGEYRRTARRQKHPRREFQHIIGSIAQHNLMGTDGQSCRQGLFQRKAVAIRVERQVVQRGRHGPLGQGRDAQRVFV